MENFEIKLDSEKMFNEEVSDTLLKIHTDLNLAGTLTPKVLDQSKIDGICEMLSDLERRATESGNKEKAEILKRIEINFYLLSTVGITDDIKKFIDQSARAFELLEMALLGMNDSVFKNRGKIMQEIEEYRGNNN